MPFISETIVPVDFPLIGPLNTYFNEILFIIKFFFIEGNAFELSSKFLPFWSSLNMLTSALLVPELSVDVVLTLSNT